MAEKQPVAETILVCVGPSSSSAGLIRYAQKMAGDLHAKWLAVYVESPRTLVLPESERNRAIDNLRLAERLGAETAVLGGRRIAGEIVDLARRRSITRIVAGKPGGPRWKSMLSPSPVDELIRIGGDIEVCVTSGEPGEEPQALYALRPGKVLWHDYGTGVLYTAIATALCFLMFPYFGISNLIMVYLLGVMVTAVDCGRGPGILTSALSVLAFDFFFVPPRYSFTVDEAQYIVTFAVMFIVATVISHLAALLRNQTETARLQERQAVALHGLSRKLASTRRLNAILEVAVLHFSEIFDCRIVVLLPDSEAKLRVAAGDPASVFHKDAEKELHLARSAFDTAQMAGLGTESAPGAEILYAPLLAADSTLGVLALRPQDPARFLLAEQRYLLESLARQVALALEVELLTGSGAERA